MFTIKRYTQVDQSEWNTFIKKANNATFLLDRRYLEYHKDRFDDHSLLVWSGNTLIALFPASQKGKQIFSHGGLTYGSLIIGPNMKLFDTLASMYLIAEYYFKQGITHIEYKPVPLFFHTTPNYNDLYALFLLGAVQTSFNTGFVRDLSTRVVIPKDGRYMIRKALDHKVQIKKARDCRQFWNDILIPHLSTKFKTNPVHSLVEIEMLRKLFPANIIQYHAEIHDKVVAGATMYVDRGVAHCQYIAGGDLAQKSGANDYLMWHLMTNEFSSQRFFSFGTANMGSTDGKKISRGLVSWKENFGTSMYPYVSYTIATQNYTKLDMYV